MFTLFNSSHSRRNSTYVGYSLHPTIWKLYECSTLELCWWNHRNLRICSYTRRSMLEKGLFFQLISNLLCIVKRGFVDPCKIVPVEWIITFFMLYVCRPLNFLQGVLSHFRTSATILVLLYVTKISMDGDNGM
jgi:hypothetical protein